MVKDRARKRDVRARMQLTGETFWQANEYVAMKRNGPAIKYAASLRASYTGERRAEALSGIAPGPGLGLDHCSPAQAYMRAVLALGLFNGNDHMDDSPLGSANVAPIVSYTVTASPRFDHLVLITGAPDNISRRLVPGQDGARGVPGMRVEHSYGHRTALLRHLPSGASLIITSRRNVSLAKLPKYTRDRYRSIYGRLTVDDDLTNTERRRLAALPPIDSDSARLLSALTVRLDLTDPAGHWAVGSFFWDPLQRQVDAASDLRMARGTRTLMRGTDGWRLQWQGYPYEADLWSSLTDSTIGLRGVDARQGATESVIRLNSASLTLARPSSS